MIDRFEILLALAKERHFGRAAEICGITQPTLSAGLKSLEEALGVMLVRRSSRFQGLTPEGERVLDWAKRIVADARAMRQDLQSLRRDLSGELRLAVIPTALAAVTRLTVPFRARHPQVTFTVLSRTSDDALRMVADFEVDAGLTYLDNEALGPARAVPLYVERYCLLTPATASLAGRHHVTWAEAGREPLCLLTSAMQNRRIVDGMLRQAGCDPAPTLESDSTIVLMTHVRTGLWSTIVPALLAEGLDLPPDVRAVPISDGPGHAVGLVVSPREPTTPLVEALLAEAQRLAQAMGPR